MTADILHAGFNILKFSLKKKKKGCSWIGGRKKGQKRTQVQYIKMSHNRLMMAVKIREKSNLSGTPFFSIVETLVPGRFLFM